MSFGVVYGLIDPRNEQLRYVGKTTTVLKYRVHKHIKEAVAGHQTHRHKWLRQLLSEGLEPDTEVLETCETADALNEAERHHIAYWRFLGCRLTNLTVGGEGTPGLVRSAENRARISAGKKGKPNGRLGTHLSEETKKRMSASNLGKVRSEATRTKIRAIKTAKYGHPVVDENGVHYPSIEEAARVLLLKPSHIRRVLKGLRKTTGGHTFSYAEV